MHQSSSTTSLGLSLKTAAVALLVASCAASVHAVAAAAPDGDAAYGEAAFDPSFYDRRAPNEKESAYNAEKKRQRVRAEARNGGASSAAAAASSSLPRRDNSYASNKDSALVHATREERILILEDDLQKLRDGELAMAMQRANSAESALRVAKSNMPWFPSAADKERIVLLENAAARHRNALVAVHKEERALELALKPLYGIVSAQFWHEQRRAISSSINAVHKMAADQTWWSTMFAIGEADSIQELLIHAVGQYFFMSLICYFFGVLFFALWTSPWTVYEYSSSIFDIFVGIPSYLAAVGLMLVPVLCLGGIAWGLFHYYGQNLRGAGGFPFPGNNNQNNNNNADGDAAARENARREAERERHQEEQRRRFAPEAPRPADDGMRFRGGFGAPVNDID